MEPAFDFPYSKPGEQSQADSHLANLAPASNFPARKKPEPSATQKKMAEKKEPWSATRPPPNPAGT